MVLDDSDVEMILAEIEVSVSRRKALLKHLQFPVTCGIILHAGIVEQGAAMKENSFYYCSLLLLLLFVAICFESSFNN